MFKFVRESDCKVKVKEAVDREKVNGERTVATLKEENESLKQDKKSLNQQLREQQRKHDERFSLLSDKHQALEELHNDRLEVEKDKVALNERDNLITAREDAQESFEKEMKRMREEHKVEVEKQQKGWYADGLADGLRKGSELAAEERKQAMQVAALAASSHTPKAALKVAEGIRDGMMLNSGLEDEGEDDQ